ncbi:MAG TPA: glycosyltransferase family 2 protein [Thermoguttaceae bacterium]|nr:glycosyltransferase family 2 protein [Thermoguttaceae bacterium]
MTFRDVSFIVIARNEAGALCRCLSSIASMPLEDCEVICVDSDSTDNTMEIMRSYQDTIRNLKIIRCSGYLNAAVARNAGMQYAERQYLFFVDGDIELCPDFLRASLEYVGAGQADAATGILDEIVYSEGYERTFRGRSHRRFYSEIRDVNDPGGTLLVRRQTAQAVGSWDARMVVNEDYDYAIRIARVGRMVALPVLMGIHHTLDYRERPWLFFRKGYRMYFGMLIRKHWRHPRLLKGIVHDYRVGFPWWGLLFLGTIMALAFRMPVWPVWAGFGLLAALDMLWGLYKGDRFAGRLFSHYLDVPSVVLGIIVNARRTIPPTEITRVA